jgi:hypothetical protein
MIDRVSLPATAGVNHATPQRQWLWAQADLTEAQLHYLISGELPGE